MDEKTAGQLVRQLADLRLQVNALEVTAKTGSLPETVNQARKTIRWSAALVAVALMISSVIRSCEGDRQIHQLERRIERLEAQRAPAP